MAADDGLQTTTSIYPATSIISVLYRNLFDKLGFIRLRLELAHWVRIVV